MKKRGLSGVVVSILLILLALIAIGVVWGLITTFMNKTTQGITITPFTDNVKIDDAKVGLLTAKIKITRTQGNANLTTLRFIFNDGTKTYQYDQTNNLPQQQESKTYDFPLENGIKSGTLKVIPIFGKIIGLEDSIVLTTDLTTNMNNGLVAYYKFENDAKDSSGNGNDGTNVGITFINGKVTQSANFNGNNYIAIPDNNALDFNEGTFSISTWIKTQNSQTQIIAEKNDWHSILNWSDLKNYMIYTSSSDGKLHFISNCNQNKSTAVTVNSTTTINDDKWYHIIATREKDSNNNFIKSIYINGNNYNLEDRGIDQICEGQTNPGYSTIEPLYIGIRNESSYLGTLMKVNYTGQMDEFIIFNRSLTQQEIQQIYLSQK